MHDFGREGVAARRSEFAISQEYVPYIHIKLRRYYLTCGIQGGGGYHY